MRKGQIGLFIIFGLIILIAFGFISYLNNQKEIKEEAAIQATSLGLFIPVRNYINICLKEVGEDALQVIGLQGGFYKEPDYKIFSKGMFVDSFHAVYVNDGKNVMPSKQTIEREISDYINENLAYCIKNFDDFKTLGYEINRNEVSTLTSTTNNSVVFNLKFPIDIAVGQKSSKMEEFNAEIPLRLDLIYNLVKDVTEDQLTHLNQICISCLIEIGDLNNFYFELIPREPNVTIIVVEDSQVKLKNKPYIFAFAFDHSLASS